MKKILSLDNPVIVFLGRVTDIMILNLLTILLCAPVVTAGAALTANYYCCLKIRRDEDSRIVMLYFKSFKENFRQSAALFFIMLVIIGVPAFMLSAIVGTYGDAAPDYIKVMLSAILLFVAFLTVMVFPVQSRFSNKVLNTIKTSMLLAVSNPLRTVLILVVNVAPILLTWYIPYLLPVYLLFGISLPAFVSVLLYNKAFLKMEKAANEAFGVPEAGSEDEHIFTDNQDSKK